MKFATAFNFSFLLFFIYNFDLILGLNSNSTDASKAAFSSRNRFRNPQYRTSVQLLKQLFRDYLDSVPVEENSAKPLPVFINAHILRLLDVDELRQVLSFSAKVDIEWKDSRLQWKPAEHSNLQRLEVPNSVSIWTPDVTWHERLEVDFAWRSQGRIMLDSDGRLTLSAQIIMNIHCYMDPGYFPFDNHRCMLTFEPLVHTKEEVVLVTRLSEGIHNKSLMHDQWLFSLLQNNCSSIVHSYAASSRVEEFIENQCTFLAERRPLYHLFNLFLPAAVITFITVFAFLIPPTEADMKIQFSLNIMLQLIVFLMYIYNSLPISATQLPLLSVFFAFCLVLVTASCMAVVAIAYTHWLGEDNIHAPAIVRRILINKLAPLLVPHHLATYRSVKNGTNPNRVSTASEPSEVSAEKPRVGIFRFAKIKAFLDTLVDETKELAEHKNMQQCCDEPTACDADLSSTQGQSGIKRQHLEEAPKPGLKRKNSQQTIAASVTTEREWRLNKATWLLISLVLDRLCAVAFVCAYSILLATVLIIGYRNRFHFT